MTNLQEFILPTSFISSFGVGSVLKGSLLNSGQPFSHLHAQDDELEAGCSISIISIFRLSLVNSLGSFSAISEKNCNFNIIAMSETDDRKGGGGRDVESLPKSDYAICEPPLIIA